MFRFRVNTFINGALDLRNLLIVVLVIYTETTVFSVYYINSLCMGSFFSMHELRVYTLHINDCF